MLGGLGFAGFAGVIVIDTLQARAGAARAEGEVVDMVRLSGSSLAPVIRFTAANGETYEFRHRQGSNPPIWAVGDRVTVLHDAEDPERAAPDTFASAWLMPIMLLTFALIFGGVGVLMWRML